MLLAKAYKLAKYINQNYLTLEKVKTSNISAVMT
jgi:hypothetical protein